MQQALLVNLEKGGAVNTMLRQEREQKGWTQKYVAEQVGTSQQAIQQLETGKQLPSYKVLVKLLELYGYKDPRELFAEVPEPQISPK